MDSSKQADSFRTLRRTPMSRLTRHPQSCIAGAIAFTLFASAAGAAEHSNDGGRFRIEAAITPRAVSDDGRFGVQARLTSTDGKRSSDGRFALEPVNVPAGGCAPAPDAMFANGFEP
jgi:hypothetical protein